jgi:hypothetical protein
MVTERNKMMQQLFDQPRVIFLCQTIRGPALITYLSKENIEEIPFEDPMEAGIYHYTAYHEQYDEYFLKLNNPSEITRIIQPIGN